MNNPVTKKESNIEPLNPAQLLQIAVEKGLDVSNLEKLMDLEDRWEAKQAKMAFNNAFSKFQAEGPLSLVSGS